MAAFNFEVIIGDVTASKAIKLTSSNYILQMERVIKAIDKSLALLSDTHRDLFKLKYMDCLTLKEVYLEMNISKRSYYRIRRESLSFSIIFKFYKNTLS